MRLFYGVAIAAWIMLGLINSYQFAIRFFACRLVGNGALYCMTWDTK